MKQKPKVGELVRILSARPEYHNGEIAKILAYGSAKSMVELDKAGSTWICDEVERVPQEGDRVVVRSCSVTEAVGVTGTVVYPTPKDFAARTATCLVDLDRPAAGRKRVYCPLTYGVELLAPETTPKKETVKVGDRVRIVQDYENASIPSTLVGMTATLIGIHPRMTHKFEVRLPNDGKTVVYAVEPVTEEKPPRQIIHITTDGKTTTAVLREGKTVLKTASAKCNPGDTFSFAEGARIAFERLQGRDPFPKQDEKSPFPKKVVCVSCRSSCAPFTPGKVYSINPTKVWPEVHVTPYSVRSNFSNRTYGVVKSKSGDGYEVNNIPGLAEFIPFVED